MSANIQKSVSGTISGILVLVLIAGVLALGASKYFGIIDNGSAQQGIGVILGVMLMLLGNFLPKLVLPLNVRGNNSSKYNRLERFSGLIFVATGALVVGVWTLAPQDSRMLVSALIVLSVFGLLASIWLRSVFGGLSEKEIEAKLADAKVEIPLSQRLAVFGFLYSIFWVFAIFLADAIWGDRVSQNMIIPFIIISAVLLSFVTIKHQIKR